MIFNNTIVKHKTRITVIKQNPQTQHNVFIYVCGHHGAYARYLLDHDHKCPTCQRKSKLMMSCDPAIIILDAIAKGNMKF